MSLNLRYPLSPMQLNAIYQWCGHSFDAEDIIQRFEPRAVDNNGVMVDVYLHSPTMYAMTVTDANVHLYKSMAHWATKDKPMNTMDWPLDHDLRFLSDAEDLDDLTNLWQCFLRYVGMTASADEFPRHLLKPLSRHWVECFCKRWDELVNQPEPMYLNYYRCPECQHYWTDEWSCACDDTCPACGLKAVSPYDSAIIHPADAATSPRIIVRVKGGLVIEVYSNTPGAVVDVLDEDNFDTAPNDDDLQAKRSQLLAELSGLTKIDFYGN